MLCFNKDAGLACQLERAPRIASNALVPYYIGYSHNLTIDKWAAGLIDGGGRTVSDGVPDEGLYDKCGRV